MIKIKKIYILALFLCSIRLLEAQPSKKHYFVVTKSSLNNNQEKDGYEVVMHLKYHHLVAAGFIGLCTGIGLVYGSYKIYSYYPQLINGLHAYQALRRNPWITKSFKNLQYMTLCGKNAMAAVINPIKNISNSIKNTVFDLNLSTFSKGLKRLSYRIVHPDTSGLDLWYYSPSLN